jgi:hypothetical protein
MCMFLYGFLISESNALQLTCAYSDMALLCTELLEYIITQIPLPKSNHKPPSFSLDMDSAVFEVVCTKYKFDCRLD